ncbi:hypothetical protein GMW39_10165 [Pectobacterium parmentieri]|uniref:hypothetical protein n=1 Tax=Pectobacterium parmentieri TaxID=1905730 RepID=UPI0013740333|nr:hypothetical protein [Pectobacterium parmentieri]QHQ16197.1 hypothetical protein GMW39_10165 [Pectobacterium parmentieri]
MSNINIVTLRFSASGGSIWNLEKELKAANFQITERSPMMFSGGAIEFLEVAIPTGGGVAVMKMLTNIILAYINKDRRAKCTLIKDGRETLLEGPTTQDLMKLIDKVQSQDNSDQ